MLNYSFQCFKVLFYIALSVFSLNAQINTFPYFEDFENEETGQSDAGGWTSGGLNSSWGLISLNPDFNPSGVKPLYAPFGEHVWKTYLDYNDNEFSWVQSPVFDLSSLGTPHIQLKIWYDCETGEDGAVLQSSIDSGTSWQNVGDVGGGTNWFNKTTISSNPGNQSKGWSGAKDEDDANASEESKGWITVIYPITNLAVNNVVFRIAFSSNSSINGHGFAFDGVQISNTSCYVGDNIKPFEVYDIDVPEIVNGLILDDLNSLFTESGKNASSKLPILRRFRHKRGPRKLFVKDDGKVDFPNTGKGPYEEHVFEYWDEAISCNGLKDVAYVIVKVGGNEHGGTDIEEEGCYVMDPDDESVQLDSNILYNSISLDGIRCDDDLYFGTWYEINGNIETGLSGSPVVDEGTYKYEGCSSNTAIINITKDDNCSNKSVNFSFENAQKTFNGTDYFFELDVMIQAAEASGTFKLGPGELSFRYNTAAFGEAVYFNGNFEVIAEGGIVSQSIDSDPNKSIYGSFYKSDISTSVVSWGYSQIYSSSTFANNNVLKTSTKLCHLKIKYKDATKDPMFEFEYGYPLDNQFSTACGPETGSAAEFADCTVSGEPGVLISLDEFYSYGSEITLSTSEPQLISEYSIYPNPTDGAVHIKGNLLSIKNIEIYSVTGNQVLKIQDNFNEINISRLVSGMYFLKLNTDNNSETFKIVKQ